MELDALGKVIALLWYGAALRSTSGLREGRPFPHPSPGALHHSTTLRGSARRTPNAIFYGMKL